MAKGSEKLEKKLRKYVDIKNRNQLQDQKEFLRRRFTKTRSGKNYREES